MAVFPILLSAGFAFLDQKLGWGFTDSPDSSPPVPSEPAAGPATSANPEQPRLGRRVSHPDDARRKRAKSFERARLTMPLPPDIHHKAQVRHGDFTTLDNRWSTSRSTTTSWDTRPPPFLPK